MAISKAQDVEAVRFAAPDLDRMKSFLLDFGLHEVPATGDGILRMRGAGSAPFVHETVRGEPGFLGLTLRVRGMDDLKALAEAEGAEVKPSAAPGGGYSVQLRDPDGHPVEAIAERARVAPLTSLPTNKWNDDRRQERQGEAKRVATAPANVVRLGHVVLSVSDMARCWAWWQSRFGLLASDEVRAPSGDLAAMFIRCDRGDEMVDHHTLNFASVPGVPPRFHHAAFEVLDLDDLMAGGRYLEEKGHHHDWGVGRHILGSQVFDYWKDPWGHRVEHWTDGDVFNADSPVNIADIPTMLGHQWGPPSPTDFAS